MSGESRPSDVPGEWVEAAAKALQDRHERQWSILVGYDHDARCVFQTVLPLIAADRAAAVAAARRDALTEAVEAIEARRTSFGATFRLPGLAEAARIVADLRDREPGR